MLIAILVALLASFATIHSGANPAASAKPIVSLAGSEWGLPSHDEIMIHFGPHRVTGFSGCNRFSGRYAFEAGYLTIGPLAVTRKTCKPAAMKVERRFLDMLDDTRRASATHPTLTLIDGTGDVLATLQRRDWD